MKQSAHTEGLSVPAMSAVAMLFLSGTANAQEAETEQVETEQVETAGVGAYLAAGLSISNTGDANFGETSYPSIEFGLSAGAGSLALVVGRANNDYSGTEEVSNYWWEIKVSIAVPIGDFGAYGLLGLGNYLSTDRFFIEYGLGVSYSWDPLSVFVQASNWDGVWYITPGLMYAL